VTLLVVLLSTNGTLLSLSLQITIELASDNKDFAATVAKMQLAEMGSVKMVPIPQQPKPNSQSVVMAKPVNNASVRTG